MRQYKVTFSVNGNRHEQIVGAGSAGSAEALIKATYPNAVIIGTPREVK